MIVVMRPTATDAQVDEVRRAVEDHELEAFVSVGQERTVIGVVGTDLDRVAHIGMLPGVESVIRVTRPYKLASIEHHPTRTHVRVGDVDIGLGAGLVVMAGPCAVESREQLIATARLVRREGARLLRGGAFKPRTSPYNFQGLGEEALRILDDARQETSLPVVSEVTDPGQVPLFEGHVDLLQVGSRNMHNFVLLRAVGQTQTPVLLKRGFGATIEEWLLAAEYILSAGNSNVILCERGIRTFEPSTRNTLDLSAIPVLRERTHLPIVVDPSHGTGQRSLVGPMALAAAAVGADGLLVEVHPDPPNARSDGDQSLGFDDFGALMDELRRMHHLPPVPVSTAAFAPETTLEVRSLRDRIDAVDTSLAELLQERTRLAIAVQQLRDPEMNGHDLRREEDLLARAGSIDGPMTRAELLTIFGSIVRASRSAQRRTVQGGTAG
jgi:3-deoxy-7-phosphoheptulonate synthase